MSGGQESGLEAADTALHGLVEVDSSGNAVFGGIQGEGDHRRSALRNDHCPLTIAALRTQIHGLIWIAGKGTVSDLPMEGQQRGQGPNSG
jgi:hypothetical protein